MSSRAGSCEKEMVGGPLIGHLSGCRYVFENGNKTCDRENTDTVKGRHKQVRRTKNNYTETTFFLSGELKCKDARSTKGTIKYKSSVIHISI